MTDMNLNELTVLELRKVAKEMKVPLSAGISKQGIIDRLTAAMAEQGAPAAAPKAAPSLEVAPEAMPEAFGSLMLKHDTFKSGVLLASNFGRDADTIGAVVGCILGARYGAKAIPPYWLEHTRYPSGTCLQFTKGIDIKDYAEKITDIIMEG